MTNKFKNNCKVVVNNNEDIKSLYDFLIENGYEPIGSKNDFKYPVIIAENGIFFNPIFNFETRCCIDCGQDIETFKSLILEKL